MKRAQGRHRPTVDQLASHHRLLSPLEQPGHYFRGRSPSRTANTDTPDLTARTGGDRGWLLGDREPLMSAGVPMTDDESPAPPAGRRLRNIARILLGATLTFTGVGHLTFLRHDFQAQVPNWVPISKDLTVVGSGVIEIVLGAALIALPRHRRTTGALAAAFFVIVFPGNIAQYLEHADTFGLDSDRARLVRLFFQPLLVAWALWAGEVFRHDQRQD